MAKQFIYGMHSVEALLRLQPKTVTQLWVQSGRRDLRTATILDLAEKQGLPVHYLDRDALDAKVSGAHQGVIAEVEVKSKPWSEAMLWQHLRGLRKPALLLVLDGVTDPHNLGACLRSADAAGVNAVIVPKDKSADLTPVVRKVACGAAETVPFIRVTNLARVLDGLKEQGIWLFGTAGEAETTLYDNDLTGPVAIVMGAEGSGLRRLTREKCDHLVKLPMAGSVPSLNVSVATGICLFEAVRQRRG